MHCADNIEPKDVDIAVMEEQLFNNPDPYDLAETERIDPALQERTTRSSTRFEVGNFIKLDDNKLVALITNVDYLAPARRLPMLASTVFPAKEVGIAITLPYKSAWPSFKSTCA